MLTVLTPAKSARLAQVDDARTDLGLSATSPSDAQLGRLLDQASSRIAMSCNRVFGRAIYRQRLLASRGSLVLYAGPVNRIISVSFGSSDPFTPDQYLLEDQTLKLASLRPDGGIGDGSGYNLWRTSRPSLDVVYEAGWLLPGEEVGDDFTGKIPLPADIERAAIQLVSAQIADNGRDPTIRSETVQGVGSATYASQSMGSDLPHPGAEAAIRPYRVFAFA
jgi:hypothetical protein